MLIKRKNILLILLLLFQIMVVFAFGAVEKQAIMLEDFDIFYKDGQKILNINDSIEIFFLSDFFVNHKSNLNIQERLIENKNLKILFDDKYRIINSIAIYSNDYLLKRNIRIGDPINTFLDSFEEKPYIVKSIDFEVNKNISNLYDEGYIYYWYFLADLAYAVKFDIKDGRIVRIVLSLASGV